MFGKHFASMYSGSMVGSGAIVFAVWGYVIANMVPDKVVGFQVELNPRFLAPILGEDVKDVVKAIEFLCSADPESRTKEENGRRLIRIGQFDYRVVNAAKYTSIRNYEARKEQVREAQRRWRERKKAQAATETHSGLKNGKPLPGEVQYVQASQRGDEKEMERIVTETLPDIGRELR